MAHRSDTGLAATTLRVTNIPGITHIKLAQPSATGMAIELSGPESILKDISWEVRHGVLHVTGPRGGGGGVTITSSFGPGGKYRVSGGGGDVFIAGRGVHIGSRGMSVTSSGDMTVISTGRRGGSRTVIVDGKVVSGPGAGADEPGEAELTVFVPQGAAIQVSDDGDGTYDIGDTRGSLDLKIEGSSQVTAGAVGAARVSVGGHADIDISAVNGSLRASIAGSGSVKARRGEVAQLNLSVSGSGSIAFGGTAGDADLDVSGSGQIRVDTVTGSLQRDVSGSGRIDVREQPRRSAEDFWR
jgi:hypothetical protein